MSEPPKKPRHPNSLANLRPFKKGEVGNPLGRSLEKTIDGVKVSKFFNENLGPVAAKVAERYLLHALSKNPKDLNALDINMTQFMLNRVYGKAEERIVMDTTVTNTDAYTTSNMSIEDMERLLASVEQPTVIDVDSTVIDDEGE